MATSKRREPRAATRTNLRDVASSFVGRDADALAVRERLEAGRLVTILGPGGMGKTRLATRVASGLASVYAAHGGGGVWFCDCTEARSVAGVAAVVATALGVRLTAAEDEAALAEELGAAIDRRGSLLLVLDNLEHLVAEARATVGLWVGAAPRARFLVTSRVALGIPGEELWPLGPLGSEDAVELFVGRARSVRPGLPLDEAQLAAVAELVHALDGIPLAIELLASRVAVLSPLQLQSRLERPHELLVLPGDEGRHASMHRTVIDSIALLGEGERDVFTACASFRGGFSLEAAEALLGGGALGALDALVRHSLIRATPVPALSQEVRFSFFEAIRDVALERLAELPERDLLSRRYVAFFAKLADSFRASPTSEGRRDALARAGLELDNLVAAHGLAVASAAREADGPGAREALAIALGLEPLLAARGLSRLRLELLGAAIAAGGARAAVDEGALAEAVVARGLARQELGEMRSARADLEDGLARAIAAGRTELAALAEVHIGEIVEVGGTTAEAHARFAEALAFLARSPAGPRRELLEAEAFLKVAHVHRREGRLDEAETAAERSVARYGRLGHDEGLAAALYEAAVVAMFLGRRDAALARFDDGLAAAHRADARATAGALTTARGCLLQEMGALDDALRHHAEAARVFRELGSRYRETSATYYLATAYLERGDPREALTLLVQARSRSEGVGSPRYETLIASCRAVAVARLGDAEEAARAMAEAALAQAECPTELALAATTAIHRLTLGALGPPGMSADGRAGALRDALGLVARHPSDDSRFALRLLRAVLEPEARARPDALDVSPRGRAFRLPGAATPVDLASRPALAGVLSALAMRRVDAPGEPVNVDEIILAGWPGEKMGIDAGRNRARVALATLRKLGLRDVLLTGPGGYWLSPAVPLTFMQR